MKHCFLILLIAFLFCCTGCSVRKSQKKQAFDQRPQNALLIKPSSENLVYASSLKNKKEELFDFVQKEQKNKSKKHSIKEQIAQIEARLGDLPLPLMAKAFSASDDGKGHYVIVSKTELSLDDLTRFYQKEMESLGWTKTASFVHEELLFLFKRHKQSCIVSMRPLKKASWWGKKSTVLYVYLQA